MSEASQRGRTYELKIQKIIQKKLHHLEIKRDSRSGAGLHKQDIRDRYNLLPLFVECKDQESLSVKKEWRITDQKANFGQAPIVVFPDDSEDLCVMRFTDLLNFIKEAADYKAELEDLRQPTVVQPIVTVHAKKPISDKAADALKQVGKAVAKSVESGNVKIDANGHITDDYGYCNQKGCKYARGYKPPKKKK